MLCWNGEETFQFMQGQSEGIGNARTPHKSNSVTHLCRNVIYQ